MSEGLPVRYTIEIMLSRFRLDGDLGPDQTPVDIAGSPGVVSIATYDEVGDIVQISFPLVTDVTETPELFRYVAEHSADTTFGTLHVESSGEHQATVFLSRKCLGSSLRADEFLPILVTLGIMANETATEVQSHFGGTLVKDL